MAAELLSVSITIPENPLQQRNSPFQKMLYSTLLEVAFFQGSLSQWR